MPVGNFGDVFCPLLPIATVADALNHAGIEKIFPRAEIEDALINLFVVVADTEVVGLSDCDMSALFVELNFFDEDVDAFVVSAQGVEHVPNRPVFRAFLQNVFGIFIERHDDGNDNVTVFFIFGTTHDAADCLNDFDFGFFRRHENYGVKRGHVDAFGQATNVRQNSAGVSVGRRGFQPEKCIVALNAAYCAVDVFGVNFQNIFLRVGKCIESFRNGF